MDGSASLVSQDEMQARAVALVDNDVRDMGAMAKGRELEVQHLTETTELSPKQAKELLKRHGNDWQKVRDEAENFKAGS